MQPQATQNPGVFTYILCSCSGTLQADGLLGKRKTGAIGHHHYMRSIIEHHIYWYMSMIVSTHSMIGSDQSAVDINILAPSLTCLFCRFHLAQHRCFQTNDKMRVKAKEKRLGGNGEQNYYPRLLHFMTLFCFCNNKKLLNCYKCVWNSITDCDVLIGSLCYLL